MLNKYFTILVYNPYLHITTIIFWLFVGFIFLYNYSLIHDQIAVILDRENKIIIKAMEIQKGCILANETIIKIDKEISELIGGVPYEMLDENKAIRKRYVGGN